MTARPTRSIAAVGRMIADLCRYGARSGRWWVVVSIPLLALAAVLIVTAKAAVPTVVYAFF